MTHEVKLTDIRHDYKKLAASYDTRWTSFNAVTHSWVLDHLDIPQNIVDVGCGTGSLLKRISEKYPEARLTGFDGTPEMIEIAKNRVPQATLNLADISQIDNSRKFDTVICINALHHINNSKNFLISLQDLCTEDGSVFLCDFAIETIPLKIAEHYWRLFHPAHHKAFTRTVLRTLIGEHFTIEKEALLQPDRFWRLQIYKLKP